MEYFIGALSTLIIVNVVSRMFRKYDNKARNFYVKITQSRAYELVRPYMSIHIEPIKPTQALKHYNSGTVRILFLEDKAYWIENNQLFEVDTNEQGMFDKESAIRVDTMGMDDVQLKRTIYIVEKLREGSYNDFGYSGNEGI